MSCQCYAATVRTYAELRRLGQGESVAYAAAVQVFRHHHPEASRIDAYQQVADWLENDEASAA